MNDENVVKIQSHGQALGILPGVGGTIDHWRDGAIDLLRPADSEAIEHRLPRQTGCYPLIPFSGRVRDGRFSFQGEAVELPINFPTGAHAIHGSAWMKAWTVAEHGADRIRLTLDHPPGPNWPWAYEAWQDFRLGPDGLTVDIGVRNVDARAFPAGLGLHPYFPRRDDTRMTAKLGGVWLYDDVLIPTHHVAVGPEWDFTTGRLVDPVRVDHTFTDIAGPIEIAWPHLKRGVRIEPEAVFDKFVIFIPEGRDYFCVEPVTIMPDAFERAPADRPGTRVLAPGDSLSGKVLFRILKGDEA